MHKTFRFPARLGALSHRRPRPGRAVCLRRARPRGARPDVRLAGPGTAWGPPARAAGRWGTRRPSWPWSRPPGRAPSRIPDSNVKSLYADCLTLRKSSGLSELQFPHLPLSRCSKNLHRLRVTVQLGKPRPRDGKRLCQGHTAGRQQHFCFWALSSKFFLLHHCCYPHGRTALGRMLRKPDPWCTLVGWSSGAWAGLWPVFSSLKQG